LHAVKNPAIPAKFAFRNPGMKLRYIISLLILLFSQMFSSYSAEETNMYSIPGRSHTENPGVNLTDVKNIPDLYFECRIAQLSEQLAVPLFYNPLVREYLEIFLLVRQKQMPDLSILSAKYFPMFEKELEKAGLPKELKYIPVIESGLNPIARSPSGARGLWQFKIETARSFGLVINETTDERTDPLKSTRAACNYLKYLYAIFGDWQLTLLAYHGGPSTVRGAIIHAGGKTSFNAIVGFLPLPTQRYLPSYVAMIYVLNNYQNHF
jgi:membrane-bound lytic murein transglycosylase D